MIRNTSRVIAVALMLGQPLTAFAQDPSLPVRPGSRIRVTAPSATGGKLVGRVVTIEPVTLTLDLDHGGRLSVPIDSITKLELNVGQRRKAREGALWGGGFGILSLTVLCLDEQSRKEGWCGAAALTVPMYAGLGALIGLAFKTSRWQELSHDRLQVGVGPSANGGLTVSLALRF